MKYVIWLVALTFLYVLFPLFKWILIIFVVVAAGLYVRTNPKNLNLKYAKRSPKTKIGTVLCWLGFHWWRYTNYRYCRRCGRHQTLYETISGTHWED